MQIQCSAEKYKMQAPGNGDQPNDTAEIYAHRAVASYLWAEDYIWWVLFSGQLSQASKQHMAAAIQWPVAIKHNNEEYSELARTETARFCEILSSSNMRMIDANKKTIIFCYQ